MVHHGGGLNMANQYANVAQPQPTTTDRWGQTPLTAEGLADHPLSLSDFNKDSTGYWRIIRGQKTYYPREWFDAAGTFTGAGSQPGDRAGQDQGFFHKGEQWNWTTGQWENPINKANLIGTIAAGGVGAGIAAPLIAGAVGGGAAAAPAAATAATAGPAAAATGGTVASWLTSPTAGLISTGIQAAAGIYGANQQANANTEAAQIQAASFEKALAQEKAEQDYQHSQDLLKQNQYADYLSRLNPYSQTGQAANNRLSQFMGQPTAAQTPLTPAPAPNPLPAQRTTIPVTAAQQSSANSFVPTAVRNSPTASQVSQAPGPYANMAVYEAPDGSRRRVPPDQEAAALAAGAKRVA